MSTIDRYAFLLSPYFMKYVPKESQVCHHINFTDLDSLRVRKLVSRLFQDLSSITDDSDMPSLYGEWE